MKVKEERKMTQRSIGEIVGDVSELCSDTVTRLGEQVFAKLQSAGIAPTDIPGLADLFADSSPYCRPFDGLDTYFRQLSFYRRHFILVVSVKMLLICVYTSGVTISINTCTMNLAVQIFVPTTIVHVHVNLYFLNFSFKTTI